MIVHRIFSWIWDMLHVCGLDLSMLPWAATLATAFTALVLLYMLYRLLAGPMARLLNHIVQRTRTKADDILLSPKIVRAICVFVVVGAGAWVMPRLCICYPSWIHRAEIAGRVMLIAAGTRVLLLEINAFCVYLRHGDNRKSGILVLRNILNTTVLAIASLIIISALMDRDPAYVVSALGAMAAVLMVVFKDSLLGMIAGIRLTVNGMLHENDWVSVPAYNADGRVEDVSLTAVKIRNWDKSVATIPPHALVSGGFVNRENMLSLGLRQIRRSIHVDATSVRRLPAERVEEIALATGMDIRGHAPRINLSLFRRHMREYLMCHPRRAVSREKHPLQVMVRELPPTPEGIPLEIFMFVDCPDWEEFEELQGDIIDEIIASLDTFGLRLYQKPSGSDLSMINISQQPALADV